MSNKFIVIAVVTIMIIGIIAVTVYQTTISSGETLESIPQADKTIARVGEQINFSSEKCKGNIIHCYWDFGDGNTSIENDPNHLYERANWYNITLIVINKNGKKAESKIKIGIQSNNIYSEGDDDRYFDVRPMTYHYASCYADDIGPNIGQPTVEIECNINQLFGNIEIYVMIEWFVSDHWESTRIDLETKSGMGNNFNLNYIIESNELPEEVIKYRSNLIFRVRIEKGGWNSVQSKINIKFPMENLDTPSA
jgi:PKD repeat protein